MNKLIIGLVTFAFVVASALTSLVSASEGEPQYDVFNLSASAQSDVKNDLMTVNLVAQAEGSVAVDVANEINEAMAWAVKELEPFTTIKTQTRDYRTYPKYSGKPSRIVGWNATQALQLESSDFEAIGSAIQRLQDRLQVQGMNLSVKPETKQAAEDALIAQAMNAFKQRALLVQQNMDASNYRVLNVNIGTGGNAPQFRQYEMAASRMSSKSAAPTIEAGDSQVTVNINGSIQLAR